jgi:hypothetical protein
MAQLGACQCVYCTVKHIDDDDDDDDDDDEIYITICVLYC